MSDDQKATIELFYRIVKSLRERIEELEADKKFLRKRLEIKKINKRWAELKGDNDE